jgi:hypothetical protein
MATGEERTDQHRPFALVGLAVTGIQGKSTIAVGPFDSISRRAPGIERLWGSL